MFSRSRVGRRRLRIGLGLVLWLAIGASGWSLVRDPRDSRHIRSLRHLKAWLFAQRLPITLEFSDPVEAAVGDPVFFRSGNQDLTLVGHVEGLVSEDEETLSPRRSGMARRIRCGLQSQGLDDLNSGSTASLISVPQTASWVFRTLLPREKLVWVASEWNRTLLEHREEVFAAIGPVLRELMGDFQTILSEDLPAALARRANELGAIGERFQETVVRKEFLPLVESEIWPILTSRAQPTIDAVGQEILARLPVWGFTWRYVYQSLPITGDDHVREAWEKFVDDEVKPILREHIDDFFGAFQDVVVQARRNPRIGEAFRRSFDRILQDRELQHELRLVFQEIILDNPRFHDAILRRWQSPRTQEAIERLSVFMGPLLSRLSDAVLGTRGGGITPEFARVLRTQILEKDRRWVILTPGPAGDPPLRWGHVFRAGVTQGE